jgi:hypothetical protein
LKRIIPSGIGAEPCTRGLKAFGETGSMMNTVASSTCRIRTSWLKSYLRSAWLETSRDRSSRASICGLEMPDQLSDVPGVVL